jgi:uncharacterized protein
MRAVLDTNIVVSAAMTASGVCDHVLRAAFRGEFRLCVTARIQEEYSEVLRRPALKLPADVVAGILEFTGSSDRYMDDLTPLNLPDPDDEIFLAAAIAAQADFLVTGNLRHFPRELRRGVEVVSPREFLQRLDQGK